MGYYSIDSEKLKELRKQRGETQEVVAKNAGITSRTLYNYEQGKVKRLDKDTIQKLADYFDVDILDIVYEND